MAHREKQPIPFGRGLALQESIASRALTEAHRRGFTLQGAIRLTIEHLVRQGTFGPLLENIKLNSKCDRQAR
ncbi:MAG: hypothetical protein GY948_04750 [Alphaproteobacteria bacterium]|nr:hypothetical protein [Alphaproteobacteria bacterium]